MAVEVLNLKPGDVIGLSGDVYGIASWGGPRTSVKRIRREAPSRAGGGSSNPPPLDVAPSWRLGSSGQRIAVPGKARLYAPSGRPWDGGELVYPRARGSVIYGKAQGNVPANAYAQRGSDPILEQAPDWTVVVARDAGDDLGWYDNDSGTPPPLFDVLWSIAWDSNVGQDFGEVNPPHYAAASVCTPGTGGPAGTYYLAVVDCEGYRRVEVHCGVQSFSPTVQTDFFVAVAQLTQPDWSTFYTQPYGSKVLAQRILYRAEQGMPNPSGGVNVVRYSLGREPASSAQDPDLRWQNPFAGVFPALAVGYRYQGATPPSSLVFSFFYVLGFP